MEKQSLAIGPQPKINPSLSSKPTSIPNSEKHVSKQSTPSESPAAQANSKSSCHTEGTPQQQEVQESLKEQYTILNKLGSGAYGHVYKVKDKSSGEVYAMKKVFSAFQNEIDAQRTYREIVYLSKLKHENVVSFKKVIRAENNVDLYLLFEYMESDLFYAVKENLLNDLHKKYIIYQIAKCLKYVHSTGIVHRDLKPSNILINPSCQIRLCDFGLSRSGLNKHGDRQEGFNSTVKLTEFIATRWYRAPEVLFGSQLYNAKSDMWSFGCLIYELYARRPLLPGNDTVEQIQKVIEFKGFPNDVEKTSFKIPKIDDILNLFDIQKKPLHDYFQHIQCQEIKEILIHLLEYNPQKRWSATDLLNCSFLDQFKDYEGETTADKLISPSINDGERKTVNLYRNMIYKIYTSPINDSSSISRKQRIHEDTHRNSKISKKRLSGQDFDSQCKEKQGILSSNMKNRLKMVQSSSKENKGNYSLNHKCFDKRDSSKKFTRLQGAKTEKKDSKSLKFNYLPKKTTNSVHTSKNTTFRGHERMTYHNSIHSVSKTQNDLCYQRSHLTQIKPKNNNFCRAIGFQKTSENNKSKSIGLYPKYLRSSTHHSHKASSEKIPKMIQERLFKKRTQQTNTKVETNSKEPSDSNLFAERNSENARKNRSSLEKSPYLRKVSPELVRRQAQERFSNTVIGVPSKHMRKRSDFEGHNQMGSYKENVQFDGKSNCFRKLKRKGRVN